MLVKPVQIDISYQGTDNSYSNRANSRIKWGLRIARGCLAPGFVGYLDVEITLVIDVTASINGELQP